ncbi:MAG: HlyC/CorC family transporter [Trueperaceae bacterium]|nr:MAG: HlyC/CorC family transporter [Trueperaceae bacterium]
MEDNTPDRSRRYWKYSVFSCALASLSLAFAQGVDESKAISLSQIALLVVLLLLSALMSGSETALTAIGEWKIRQLREEGNDPSGIFALLEKEPTRFITTLLIGNNLVNIAATALVTQITINLSRFYGFGEPLAVGYATGIMTLLVLIFGEITPKSFAVHNAVAFSRLVIRPVYVLSVVLYPVGLFFTWVTSSVLRLFRLEPVTNPLLTENELRLMLRSAGETGVIEAQEEEMIKGVIDLEETVVREVMTPRVEMVAIQEEANLEELSQLVTEHGFSRLPVYGDTIDHIDGVVYARDLLPYLQKPESLVDTRCRELMTPPYYVPETLSVLSLLRDMRIRKNHMAIVVDEFGGTSGLVTLEDIIEEITGEIYDETDTVEEDEIKVLEDGRYRIQGSVHLEEVARELEITFNGEGEYDTLAGFLIDVFGYIPQVGEALNHQGVRFVIKQADQRRIIEVLASSARDGVPVSQLPEVNNE